MNSGSFNTDMLRLARDAREATQEDLARMAGVTQALMSKIENGLVQPSKEIVTSISEGLRFPAEFFYQSERATGFPHFHFRKRAKLGQKPLNRINAIINIRRQHIAKLLRSYETSFSKTIPEFDLVSDGVTPEKIASRMREYWMLPRGPISNLTEIIEGAGGIIVQARFDTRHLDGLSFRYGGLPPLFFLNKDMPADRYRFSLAHELGHMVMHSMPGEEESLESEANRFAAAFLMPAEDIRPYLGNIKFASLARVKAMWNVSIKALIYRAKDLKLITDYQFKSLSIEYNKSFREGEPQVSNLERPKALSRMVRFHIEELGYSPAELAQVLCVQEPDLRAAYLDQPNLRVVSAN